MDWELVQQPSGVFNPAQLKPENESLNNTALSTDSERERKDRGLADCLKRYGMILSQIYVSSQYDEPNYFVTKKKNEQGGCFVAVNSPLCISCCTRYCSDVGWSWLWLACEFIVDTYSTESIPTKWPHAYVDPRIYCTSTRAGYVLKWVVLPPSPFNSKGWSPRGRRVKNTSPWRRQQASGTS